MTCEVGLQRHWTYFTKRQVIQCHLLNRNTVFGQEVIGTKERSVIVMVTVMIMD